MDTTDSPNKALGQHWLNDPASLQAMCDAANVGPDDVILEVGPGPGSLTELLLQYSKRVVAVELDQKLAAALIKKFPNEKLDVVQQSILDFDFNGLPEDYKIVANIPYYLTSNLIRAISETPNSPTVATMLIQKEVAERVAAKPGEMSLLSVTAQYFWQVELGMLVPAELFTPPPKVDSQIMILKRRDEILYPDVDSKRFFHLVKAGFSQRRKTLLNSLSGGLDQNRDEIRALCKHAGIDCERRAQTLSLDEWHSLYEAVH